MYACISSSPEAGLCESRMYKIDETATSSQARWYMYVFVSKTRVALRGMQGVVAGGRLRDMLVGTYL